MKSKANFPGRAPLGRFLDDDSGAVTVDFVVITGGIIGLGIAVVGEVRNGAVDLADGINTSLGGASVASIQQALANVHAGGGGAGGAEQGGGGANENAGGQGNPNAGGGQSAEGGGQTAGLGNPGNDKPVGKAGENPSGKGFGDGIKGKSQ